MAHLKLLKSNLSLLKDMFEAQVDQSTNKGSLMAGDTEIGCCKGILYPRKWHFILLKISLVIKALL